MEHWEQEMSHPPPPTSQPLPHGSLLEIGIHIGETNSRLETLITEVRELPEQIVMHLAPVLRPWVMAPVETPRSGWFAQLRPLTQFLQSGLPYVVLGKRVSILVAIWMAAAIGNYNSKEIAEIIVNVVKDHVLSALTG